MLKYWNVTYQIGTHPARVTVCITDGNQTTAQLDSDLRKMLAIRNGVTNAKIRLIKVQRKHASN